MRQILFLVISLSGAVAGAAQQYDDPAVAACQFRHFGGRSLPSGWERTQAEINGLEVRIVFAASVLNTRPTEREYLCAFKMRDDGRYEFATPQPSAEALLCRAEIDSVDIPNISKLSMVERQPIIARMEECQEILAGQLKIAMNMLTEVVMPLGQMGLLPINPADTSLQPH